MTLEQLIRDDERLVRRYEYDDSTIIAVDMGAAEANASVDLVDTTAIVVTDADQYELDLPVEDGGDAHTFIKNGVLTIEMEDTA